MAPTQIPIESREYITPDARIGLTIGNIIAIAGVVAAAVIAWQKIPSSDDVKSITRESINQAMVASQKSNVELEEKVDARLDIVETKMVELQVGVAGMNTRMDNITVLLAGSVAEDMHQNIRARKAVDRVRKNLKAGGDPLEGLPWTE